MYNNSRLSTQNTCTQYFFISNTKSAEILQKSETVEVHIWQEPILMPPSVLDCHARDDLIVLLQSKRPSICCICHSFLKSDVFLIFEAATFVHALSHCSYHESPSGEGLLFSCKPTTCRQPASGLDHTNMHRHT